jgi:hypothetical protein
LNITQPPDWLILFEDDTVYESAQGSWSDVARAVIIDGMMVYETYKPVKEVHLFFSRRIEVFVPPTPRPCFAYKRLAIQLGDDEGKGADWLYTCFGYIDHDDRVTLVVSPTGLVTTTTLRSFPLTP